MEGEWNNLEKRLSHVKSVKSEESRRARGDRFER